MIDTLTSKTQELIIMERDPSMMSWLQEWKRQTVDMEPRNKFELQEDEKEAFEDVHQEEEPSQNFLHIAENAPFGESESA